MNRHRSGFTLVEILLAIFIFSLLLTTLYGSFRVFTTSSGTLSEGSFQYEMVQGCLTRLVEDIENIYVNLPPSYKQPETGGDPDPYRIEGDINYMGGSSFSSIRFTSLAHVRFGRYQQRNGVAEIIYYVTSLDNGEMVLRRSDRLYPFEEFEEKSTDPIVCKNVQGFEVMYRDENGEETESWDSESSEFNFSTPRLIGISLSVGDEDEPMLFTTMIFIPAYRVSKV